MKILYIGAWDFMFNRAILGSTHEKDFFEYLHHHTEESMFLSTREWGEVKSKVQDFSPDIIYLWDCDKPRDHFTDIIRWGNLSRTPVCLISNDLFYFDLVCDEPNTHRLDAILSSMRMNQLMHQYRRRFPTKYIDSLPTPYVNTNQFKDYHLPKQYDIVIFGQMDVMHPSYMLPLNDVDQVYLNGWKARNPNLSFPEEFNFYPLRKRVTELVMSSESKYNVHRIPTPPRSCWNCPIRGESLSKIINQGYLCLSTRSRSDRCMQKYFEILGSGTVVLGDIPTDFSMELSPFIVEVTNEMTDEEILKRIDTVLANRKELEQLGREAGEFTRKRYGHNQTRTFQTFTTMTQDIINTYNKNKLFVSNTCVNINIYKHYNREYNHPFVGCLFVNDKQYIKFCSHFEWYVKQPPRFDIPHQGWYNHPHITPPYPVMYLDDVEIHWIHEESEHTLMEKYTRRLDRLTPNAIPYFLLSRSELLQDYSPDELDPIIKSFTSIPGSIYIDKHPSPIPNVIHNIYWTHEEDIRDKSGIYRYNNQDLVSFLFIEYLEQKNNGLS